MVAGSAKEIQSFRSKNYVSIPSKYVPSTLKTKWKKLKKKKNIILYFLIEEVYNLHYIHDMYVSYVVTISYKL